MVELQRLCAGNKVKIMLAQQKLSLAKVLTDLKESAKSAAGLIDAIFVEKQITSKG